MIITDLMVLKFGHFMPITNMTLTYIYLSEEFQFEEVVYKVKIGRKTAWWQRPCGNTGSTVCEKTILNGISGIVCPGEMLAMLGPSGSGKTTLLAALGGRLGTSTNTASHFSGKLTYNGMPFSGAMRRRTGFVAQDDVLYPHLTVIETLHYTALLRLPSTLSAAEKAAHAEAIMVELGLARVAHSVIGGVRGVRGVSGGERKRVSVGLEMLVNPSLLLLDEPSSGLDSTTASKIIGTLKRMSVQGRRTVVVTIHQPSSRLYHMFDKVLLLSADGSPIYYGRASDALSYFASIGFTCSLSINPADLMLDLANGKYISVFDAVLV
jgi:ABC-type multidrug transport system ATPase subunit